MDYFLLSVLGLTMFANQQHQIFAEMIDMDTGEVILILPENSGRNKNFYDLNIRDNSNEKRSLNFEEFKNITSVSNSMQSSKNNNNKNGIETLSCSSSGSCDGKVTLEKSTRSN